MRNLHKILENKNIDYEKLLEYGFCKTDNKYLFETLICDNCFKVVIEISNQKQISKVIDLGSNEEYVLVDVTNSSGEFIGNVREQYENILKDIFEKCTVPNIFKSKQAKEVIRYVKEKYHDELEYLWVKFPNNAVWRNKENHKWYGALLILNENKLDCKTDKMIEIIDLRYPKDKIKEVVDNKKVYPGYHMNKDNWITIKLDNSVDTEMIFEFIDNSYHLSLKK